MQNIVNSLMNESRNIELLSLLQQHEDVSYIHSISVARMAEYLLSFFEFKEIKDKKEIIEGALLHDIGKIFVSAEILTKSDKLTEIEQTVVHEHPRCGGILVHDRSEVIQNIVRYHHEYLDGSGYPYGLTAESIPDYCRFITAIDVIEAMLGERPYKPAYTFTRTYDSIKDMNNGHNMDMYYFTKVFKYIKAGGNFIC